MAQSDRSMTTRRTINLAAKALRERHGTPHKVAKRYDRRQAKSALRLAMRKATPDM